jgi:SAM-dependent methyltransferase
MPTSDPRQLGPIVQELVRLAPASVLDVGAGYGKYGPLIREYVDDCQWRVQVDAIEGFADYVDRSPAYRAYDHVHVGTLASGLAELSGPWDVALLVDVLEHFQKLDGEHVLDALRCNARRVIVATPREPSDQGDPPPYGNDLETHRARWTENDLASIADVERFVPVPGDEQIVVTLTGLVR